MLTTRLKKTKDLSGNASYRCSMSSSADFSDEDDFSQKSGSASPAPGDTLPWNLPKHERSKRKIQGGSVLDPAERAVLRIADERDRVQKKTFTKWINQHLMKVRKHVNDLYEDLRDGHNLISLLEVLSGDTLPREKGRMRFHRLQNVQIALDYLKKRKVKLVNIRNDDITDGNPKLTLGLIWTIILHFQISDIHVTGESEDMSAKERLLLWTQQATEGYAGIRCENFTTCWQDGRLFNAIIHKYSVGACMLLSNTHPHSPPTHHHTRSSRGKQRLLHEWGCICGRVPTPPSHAPPTHRHHVKMASVSA
uniref:Calponin-homology (CH) domain-containing protein n=1 Tax=Sphenodon punctatus TaxID=8508 RepID=A0A8D0L538_SPHPU